MTASYAGILNVYKILSRTSGYLYKNMLAKLEEMRSVHDNRKGYR